MKRLSDKEINSARAELKPTAEQLADEVFQAHVESLRPKAHVELDAHPDWLNDIRPRWNGQLVPPISKQ